MTPQPGNVFFFFFFPPRSQGCTEQKVAFMGVLPLLENARSSCPNA